MATWSDFIGTVKSYIRIGFSGPRLKDSSGNLIVRNAGDSADAEITASKVKVSGEIVEINSDAAGAGADWKYTLQRPTSGMTAAVVLTLPPTDGSPNEFLQTDGNGNLVFAAGGDTSACDKIDSTNIVFGTSSPLTLFTLPAGATIQMVEIIIDTAFNGTPSVSIGIAGTTSKYASATDIDLTQPAGTVIQIAPGVAAPGGTEALIATYAANGASAGAARIRIYYAIPS